MKKRVFSKLALLLFTLILQLSLKTNAQTLSLKIDSLLNAKYHPTSPGAVFLVAQNGNVIYKKAFGLANLELDVPMRVENVFEIGSMTKQFTAISILMLMETGKLSLKDEITKFIPDYPVHGKIITVHHLLTHTSGIKDYTSMKELMNISKQDLTPTELINFFKNEPMDFSPAENYKYNNSGYIILGHIIEKISGKSYADFVEENIFKKLGMTSSYYASHSKIFKNRVTGYQDKNGFKNAMQVSFTLPYAAGALISNVDDMLKWQTALINYKLIKKETLELAFTNYTLNNGDKINYGYGWNVKEIHGMSSLEHGGSIFGFKSMGVYIPNKNIYVIGLNNCDCNSPTLITKEIAALVVEIVKK